ncbi:hypothetical protein HK098_002970 [Nowakowskiella sp. JEL0407]|nr:hypothetical protein HK098_002970 [Nowakowskiella sp. JEL0407]
MNLFSYSTWTFTCEFRTKQDGGVAGAISCALRVNGNPDFRPFGINGNPPEPIVLQWNPIQMTEADVAAINAFENRWGQAQLMETRYTRMLRSLKAEDSNNSHRIVYLNADEAYIVQEM